VVATRILEGYITRTPPRASGPKARVLLEIFPAYGNDPNGDVTFYVLVTFTEVMGGGALYARRRDKGRRELQCIKLGRVWRKFQTVYFLRGLDPLEIPAVLGWWVDGQRPFRWGEEEEKNRERKPTARGRAGPHKPFFGCSGNGLPGMAYYTATAEGWLLPVVSQPLLEPALHYLRKPMAPHPPTYGHRNEEIDWLVCQPGLMGLTSPALLTRRMLLGVGRRFGFPPKTCPAQTGSMRCWVDRDFTSRILVLLFGFLLTCAALEGPSES